jgi:hypothetical protein
MVDKTALQPNRVTAMFRGTALSFDVTGDTTLAQLAERLGALGEIHGGLLLPVNVRVPGKKPH